MSTTTTVSGEGRIGTGDRVRGVLSAREIRRREREFESRGGVAAAAESGLGAGGFGSVDEHSGAYAYSVPIEIPPPANRGPVPRLALTYNSMSSRQPSLVGAGWRLAIDSVERVSADPVDERVDFRNDQNDLEARDTFHLRVDGMSFKLVPRNDDPNLFFAKNESGYAEARRIPGGRPDPVSGQPIIDGWVVTLGRGTVYVFGELGDDGAADSEVLNKYWALTELRGPYGQRSTIEYQPYANRDNEVWEEAPYPYPMRVRCGLDAHGGGGDGEVEMVYEEGDPPSGIDGYGNLGIGFTGRPNPAQNGLTCILWRRLRAVRIGYRDEGGRLALHQEVRLATRTVGPRTVVDRIDEVFFRDGEEDAASAQPPHRFGYDLAQGDDNPVLMVEAHKPSTARDLITYERAHRVDPEAEHVGGVMLVTGRTVVADDESWLTRYRYLGGLFYTPFQEYRGHREVEAIDDATGQSTLTRYEQNGVHNGCRNEVIAKDSDGRPISRETLRWLALDYGGGRMMPFVQRSTKEAYHDRTGAVVSSEVTEIPPRDGADPSQGYAIDDYGCPEVEELRVFEGPAGGEPVLERRAERRYLHLVGDEVGQRFIGLERELRVWARIPGAAGGFELVESVDNVHDRRGRIVESTMHIDRDDPGQVYKKYREYHPRTGAVLREHRGDRSTRKLINELRYYEDGPYRYLLCEQLDAAGNAERFLRYDLAHRQATEAIVGSGMLRRRSFDSAGRPLEEIYSGHRDSARAVEEPNSVRHRYVTTEEERSTETVNLHTGSFIRTEVDPLGRVTRSIRSIDGGRRVVVEKRYDPRTRKLAAESEPYELGSKAELFSLKEYEDPRSRLSRELLTGGMIRSYRYDGLTTATEDLIAAGDGSERHRLVEETRDARGLTVRRSEGLDRSPVRYEIFLDYDEDSRLVRVHDSLDRDLERRDYGSRIDDKPVEIWDPSRGATRIRYGPLGEIAEARQDFAGRLDRSCRMQHDGLGRLERQVDEATADGARREIRMEYDARPHGLGLVARRQVVETSELGSYEKSESYAYDPFGLAERIDQSWDIDWPALGLRKRISITTGYRHDGRKGGRLERIEHPRLEGLGGRVAEYSYDDPSGLLTEIRLDGRPVWSAAAFTLRGQVAAVRLGNGLEMDYRYDEATGRVEKIITRRRGTTLLANHLQYDTARTVVGRSVERMALGTDGEELPRRVAGRYVYDDKDQLVEAREEDLEQRFLYHPHGGRRRCETPAGTSRFVYDGASPHQVTRIEGERPHALAYDRAGNLVRDRQSASGAERELIWNPSNRVRTVRVRDGEGREVRATHYGYGATQERCFTADETARRLTLHVNDRMDLEWRLDEDRLIVHTHLHNGARRIATVSEEQGYEPRIHYYHRDHLGSVCVLSDSDGRPVYSARLAPFGGPVEESGVRPDVLFAGHRAELVDEEGFTQYEMRARHYDPDLGAFISPDPHLDEKNVGFGYNRYVYSRNSPLTLFDETGLGTSIIFTHEDFFKFERHRAWMQLARDEGFELIVDKPDELLAIGKEYSEIGKDIKHLVLNGHGHQTKDLLWYARDVIKNHDVNSITNLGCEGKSADHKEALAWLRELREESGNQKRLKYFASSGRTDEGLDSSGKKLELTHGEPPREIKLKNIKKGRSPFAETITSRPTVAAEVKSAALPKTGKKVATKFLSKAGKKVLGAVPVVGMVYDGYTLVDSVKRGDVEQAGKAVGTIATGFVPGGDIAFEVGYSIGEAINSATDNYIPDKIAEAAESIGLHKALYHTAKWLGIW